MHGPRTPNAGIDKAAYRRSMRGQALNPISLAAQVKAMMEKDAAKKRVAGLLPKADPMATKYKAFAGPDYGQQDDSPPTDQDDADSNS